MRDNVTFTRGKNKILDHPTDQRTLTLKHRETHGCVVSTVATDAKAPGHQYPQYWLNIQFIGPVSYENITNLLDNIRK